MVFKCNQKIVNIPQYRDGYIQEFFEFERIPEGEFRFEGGEESERFDFEHNPEIAREKIKKYYQDKIKGEFPKEENFKVEPVKEGGYKVTIEEPGGKTHSYNTLDIAKKTDGFVSFDGEKVTITEPDLAGAYRDMGFDVDNNPEAKKSLDELNEKKKRAFSDTKSYKEYKFMEETNKNAAKTEEKVKIKEPTKEQFQKIVEENPEFKKQLEKVNEKLNKINEEIKNKGEEVEFCKKSTAASVACKLAKLAVKGAAGALVINAIKNIIDSYRDSQNGCWLVNTKNGQRCKIREATCQDKLLNADGVTICSICNIYKDCYNKPDNSPSFNPCMVSAVPDQKVTENDYTDGYPGCMIKDNVITCDKCKSKTYPSCGSDKTSVCSPQCNKSLYTLPDYYNIECVNMSFWQAAHQVVQAVIEEPLNLGEDILNKLLGFLPKVLLIFVAVIVGYMVLKWIFSKHETQQQPQINISEK